MNKDENSNENNNEPSLRPTKRKLKNIITPYLLLLPWIIGFTVFILVPLIRVVYMTFFKVELTGLGYQYEFNGIGNYIGAFTNPVFLESWMEFIPLLIIYVITIIVISLIIAMLLNKKFKGRVVFRAIFFLPVVLLSNALLEKIMSPSLGETPMFDVTNNFIYLIIGNYNDNAGDIITLLFDNLQVILWFTGVPIILFITALQKIDKNIYESAQIDGANSWQMAWKIVIPSLTSTAMLIVIFSVVQIGVSVANPLYNFLRDASSDTTKGLGMASTYSLLYTLIVLSIIGIAAVIFRERKTKSNAYSIKGKKVKGGVL